MNKMEGLDIKKLKELQLVFGRKIEVAAKMDELPSNLATKRELLHRIQKNWSQNNERYSQIQKELSTARVELQEAEQMRERSEMRMGEISTQREYETLEKEIRAISDREIKVKDFIAQLEHELEQHKERVEREKELIKVQEEELKTEEQRVKKDTQHYQEMQEKLGRDESKIVSFFDEEFLYKFQRIIKSLEGEGVVPLVNNVCSGCHMILPQSFANAVRQNQEILFCPYCSKVLYYVADENASNSSDSYADIIESFDDEMVQEMDISVGFDEMPLDMGSSDEEVETVAAEDEIIEGDEENTETEGVNENNANSSESHEEDGESYEGHAFSYDNTPVETIEYDAEDNSITDDINVISGDD